MAVVISDFEIIPEAPGVSGAQGGTAQTSTPPAAEAPKPDEIAKILRHELERLARVRAH